MGVNIGTHCFIMVFLFFKIFFLTKPNGKTPTRFIMRNLLIKEEIIQEKKTENNRR